MLLHPVTGAELEEATIHTGMLVSDAVRLDPSVKFSRPYRWIFVVWSPYWLPEFPQFWSNYKNFYVFISIRKPEVTE